MKVALAAVAVLIVSAETIAETSPAQAREILATVIEPATLTPGPDGYSISLAFTNGTAALASGRPVFDAVGCGGRI